SKMPSSPYSPKVCLSERVPIIGILVAKLCFETLGQFNQEFLRLRALIKLLAKHRKWIPFVLGKDQFKNFKLRQIHKSVGQTSVNKRLLLDFVPTLKV